MSELTFVSCPTCGLPAELLFVFDDRAAPEAEADYAPSAKVRCINMHVSVISADQDGPAGLPESPGAEAPSEPAAPEPVEEIRAEVLVARVRPLRDPARPPALFRVADRVMRRAGRIISAAWSWRPLWALIGALAGVALFKFPLLALGIPVIALICLPVRSLLAAQRTWATFEPPCLPNYSEPWSTSQTAGLEEAA